jgi:hypothetical protein
LKFEHYLTETIDNYFKPEQKKKYSQQIYELLQKSYEKVGGLQGSGFRSAEDMIKNIPMWKVFRRGDEVKAVMMYKDKGGRKRVAIGTDGSDDGKNMLKKMLQDEYKSGRSFGEVSDSSLRFIQRLFSEAEMKKFTVPFDVVQKTLKGKELKDVNGYSYKRKIGGEWHEKIMLGNPNAPHIEDWHK